MTSEVGKQLNAAAEGLGDQLEGVSSAAGQAVDQLSSQVSGLAGEVGSQAAAVGNAFLEALPPPARDVVQAAAGPVSKVHSNSLMHTD